MMCQDQQNQITVCVSSPLRDFSGSESELRIVASNVRAALDALQCSHPKLYRSICDETGRVRRHVNLFVNELHISERQGLDTPLEAGDVLTLLPAVSGG
jgi:molybdopterin synthase sulfur carrier subunit